MTKLKKEIKRWKIIQWLLFAALTAWMGVTVGIVIAILPIDILICCAIIGTGFILTTSIIMARELKDHEACKHCSKVNK